LDVRVELGIAIGVLYAPVVILFASANSVAVISIAASVCTVLALAGVFWSPEGGEFEAALANRFLSLLAIWGAAYMGVRRHSVLVRLEDSDERLRHAVAELEEHDNLRVTREQDYTRRARAMASVLEDLRLERSKLRGEIARRVRAERDKAQFDAIVEASGDAITGATLSGVLKSWNKGATRLYGYAADEVVGRSMELLTPADRVGESRDMLRRVGRGETSRCETVRLRKDGSHVEVSVTVSPILNERGETVGVSTIARDITERKRADQLVHLAVEASPSGMLMADSRGRVVLVNSKLEEIFGYSREDLVGKPVEYLLPARLRDVYAAKFAEFIRNPGVLPMSEGPGLVGRTSEGLEVPIQVGVTPVESYAGFHVLAAVLDVTERRRMISDLRAKTAEMQQLLYVVSHDLKSPLVTIQGFADLMGRHLEAGFGERAAEAAQRVQRGVRTMSRLIDDILELSRLSSRALKLDRVNLRDVVDEVVESLELPIRHAQATVTVLESLPEHIFADRGQLLRVLLNLMGNALKYGCPEPGGTVQIGGEQDPTEVRVFVRDEGPGIAPEHHERVFELFQRLGADGEGTGLGLASVTKAMERHRGRAWVDSVPGAGATFWFALPNSPRSGVPRDAARTLIGGSST